MTDAHRSLTEDPAMESGDAAVGSEGVAMESEGAGQRPEPVSGLPAPGHPETAPAGPLLRLVRRQEVAFALVGGFNTLMGMALTIFWLTVLGGVVNKDVAAALSVALAYAVGMVIAFVLHRTLVFRVRGHVLRDFIAFVGVNAVGMVLNMVLLQLAVSLLHAPDKPAAVVVMGLVAVASFFGHRHISFRRTDSAPTDADR
ncbi:GtrA family protein [Nocardia sp. CDC160]|uniref:GtrA family protein n=1 Tax=Nocardia sp. CDC160 TaxID=3112166 RepID=UPI002DB6FFE9|nr:GtrA family protein [Nocardia sp. CDC160]MEC3919738.1 GtrA family protein [Nocardia sp. CDC160]